MKSFDEFFEENFEDGLSDPSKYILKFTFEAGQQSKQAEADHLQKRIDEALIELEEAYRKGIIQKPRCIIDSMKILKGEQL